MSGRLGYDELRVDTVRQVAKLMAGAADGVVDACVQQYIHLRR